MHLNILVITTQRWPLEHPFMEEVLAKGLPGCGHRVTVMLQSNARQTRVEKSAWHGAEVWVLPGRGRASAMARLANLFAKPLQVGQAYIALKNAAGHPDIIFVRNDFQLAFWAFNMRWLFGMPVVFQYSFPAATAQRATLPARLSARFQRALLQAVVRRADHVLPISEWMKAELVSWGLPGEKMTPFPLGVDGALDPQSIGGEEVRAALGLGDAPAAIYFGSMHPLRGLGFLLRAWAQVQARRPEARLLMVGGETAEIRTLKAECARLNIEDSVVFTGRVPRAEVPGYIAAAQVGLSPIPPTPLYWISSPTKLVETMGMARPVVANDIPEQRALLEARGGGRLVAYEEGAFAAAILDLLNDPAEAGRMGQAGYDLVQRERTYQAMTARLERLLNGLTAGRRTPQV